jgi:hypothetical protein
MRESLALRASSGDLSLTASSHCWRRPCFEAVVVAFESL